MARPNPDVPSHQKVIPLLGGLGLVLAVVPWVLFAGTAEPRWYGVCASLAVVAALGAYKDWVEKPVSPALQLVVQSTALSILWWSGFRVVLTGMHVLDMGLVLTMWLVILNAWNFIDIIDGLAASASFAAATVCILLATTVGNAHAATIGAALAGASLGYLRYNWPPARVFMGDIGSFGLGVTTIALMTSMVDQLGRAWPLSLFIVVFPLFDFVFTVSSRIIAGRSPLQGGNEHLALRLAARGWTTQHINFVAVGVSVFSGVVAFGLSLLVRE